MNQVFIVTPFGVKNGIDFSQVERELIQPAIKAIGFGGGTTGEIIKQGNIRTDMFQKLLVADAARSQSACLENIGAVLRREMRAIYALHIGADIPRGTW
jgi:hypothetical protein